MTQDEMIEMARQAATGMPGFTSRTKNPTGAELEFYKRLTNLAVAKEREACAKVADGWPDYDVQGLADAIRARGQE